MRREFSKQEKSFLLKGKCENPYKKYALAVLLLLFGGIIFDATNGFYILRGAKSFGWAIGGLILLSTFYLIGEIGTEWINSKDHISSPLYKRTFHLLLLLCFLGALAVVLVLSFRYLGW